ncbi:MAG: radical SAM protein [Candidatus Gracilibacteria bacterium]|nr:radical SAM protein [Candidatus Gracilibacteria bacterium]
MESKLGNEGKIYINEIIRVTYKCNWKCKFCNVLKTNNFLDNDVTDKEVIYQILNLVKKYNYEERENIILSFSGGEPTLNKNLLNYIKLAKTIGIGVIEIQTNGTTLFKNKNYILELINAGLNEIFLAQHSNDIHINSEIGSFYDIEVFKDWVNFIINNGIHKKISIYLNIVVTSINIFGIYDYITYLIEIGFINIIPRFTDIYGNTTSKISFGFVQPNGYAELNKKEVLLKYDDFEIQEITRIIELCKQNLILPDFHFVCPPICILNYPEYNLEYERLKNLENDSEHGNVNENNLDSYKILWKEKKKLDLCKKCNNNKYCLGFYKNWLDFVGEDYVIQKINKYIKNYDGIN